MKETVQIRLLDSYLLKKDEDAFRELYQHHITQINRIARRYSKNNELQSHLTECYLKLLNTYDRTKGVKLEAFLEVRLRQRAIDYAKREYNRNKLLTDGDELDYTPSTYNLEDEIESRLYKKTEADKRQLIDSLSENSNSLTTAIISEYRQGNTRPTAIGETLHIHRHKVTRTLQKLANNYDESTYGDIDAYLAI